MTEVIHVCLCGKMHAQEKVISLIVSVKGVVYKLLSQDGEYSLLSTSSRIIICVVAVSGKFNSYSNTTGVVKYCGLSPTSYNKRYINNSSIDTTII